MIAGKKRKYSNMKYVFTQLMKYPTLNIVITLTIVKYHINTIKKKNW